LRWTRSRAFIIAAFEPVRIFGAKGDELNMLARTMEPELMLDADQAEAYAKADFSEPHQRYVELCRDHFGAAEVDGWVLDLGCGPGDVTFRFARAFPKARMVGVDGSGAMLEWARKTAKADPSLSSRVQFVEGYLPRAAVPEHNYSAIISNSLLHHLPEPMVLWEIVCRYGRPGTQVCIMDLRRPATEDAARSLMTRHCGGEPEVLRMDFYNSLLAAFTPDEVRQQLERAGLGAFTVESSSDRHLLICGKLQAL